MALPDHLPPELRTAFLDRLAAVSGEILGHLAALEQGGEKALRTLAHQLRGSGSSFGFPEVTEAAGRLEDAPTEGFAATAGALVDAIAEILARNAERILIVDDDPTIIKLLELVLRSPRRQLRIAATGEEAGRIMAEEGCDLVILDLFLPDEDGRRLLERWRAAPATATVPVIVLSARLGADVEAECYALGADGYFEKPFDPKLIVSVVQGRFARRGNAPAPGAPPEAPAAAAQVVARAARILVAEDDTLVARIVTHRLERVGHIVTHLPDGGGVLAHVAKELPDLLILDIKMPELDGLEVLRRLRADPATRTVPVVLLTALGEEEDVVRGFSLGADDYLVKPFSPTELAVRVDRLLRRP